jgi:hypothetical protein
MTAYYAKRDQVPQTSFPSDVIGYAEEVHDFIFPLKPDTDHHARVALAAYAASVAEEKPRLAQDLFQVLSDQYPETSEEESII